MDLECFLASKDVVIEDQEGLEMAFFDGISRTISQTKQSAVRKTKDMADVAKISSAITDEERNINRCYTQIGQVYAKMHVFDYEESFAHMMVAIQQSESKISSYRQQIREIKGIVICEKCGAEVSGNVSFCSFCGTPVRKHEVAIDNADMIQCIGCGQMVARDKKFCTACGRLVAESIQAQMADRGNAGAEDAGQMDVQQMDGQVCANCGALIEEGTSFCMACGKPVSANVQVGTLDPDVGGEEDAEAIGGQACVYCGAPIEEGTSFCMACGKPVSDSVQVLEDQDVHRDHVEESME